MKNLFFLFFILLGIAGCDMSMDFGPFVRITYSYPDGTMTNERLEFISGSDAVVELSLNGLPIQQLKVDGIVVSSNDTVLFFDDITKDHEIFVMLKEKQRYYTLSSSSTAGGRVSPSGDITVKKDSVVNYTAVSDHDSKFHCWVLDGDTIFSSSANYALKADTSHALEAKFVKKEIYTVVSSCDEYATVAPSGVTTFLEGDSLKVTATAKALCSIMNLKVNGSIINGTSYIFKNSGTFEVTSQRGSEWYFCQGKWKNTSQWFGEVEYNPLDEILEFLSDGTCKRCYNGTWSNDGKWTKSATNIITLFYGGWKPTVDTVDNEIMIFHYLDQSGGIVTKVYQKIK